MKYRVILAVFAGFILGAYFAGLGLPVRVYIFSGLVLGVCSYFYRSVLVTYLLALTSAGFLGSIYFNAQVTWRIVATKIPAGSELLTGTLASIEPRGPNSRSVRIRLDPPGEGSIYAAIPVFPEYRIGNRVSISGKGGYVIDKWGRYFFDFPKTELLDQGASWGASYGPAIREKATRILMRSLPGREGALTVGLLSGDTSAFDQAFKQALRESGTTHLVALSGYNITVIVGALTWMTRTMRLRARLSFPVAIAGIILFLTIVNAQPSLFRAAIMGILFMLAAALGRAAHFGYAAALAGVVMVIFDPTAPAADIGFQLSFLSLLGVGYIAPLLRRVRPLAGEAGFMGWRDSLAATAGAQLAVLPILVNVFGGFSIVSLLSNLLILWCIPPIMFLSAALVMVGALIPALAELLSLLVWLPAAFVVRTIMYTARLGGGLIAIPLRSIWSVAAYYSVLAALLARSSQPFRTFTAKYHA